MASERKGAYSTQNCDAHVFREVLANVACEDCESIAIWGNDGSPGVVNINLFLNGEIVDIFAHLPAKLLVKLALNLPQVAQVWPLVDVLRRCE